MNNQLVFRAVPNVQLSWCVHVNFHNIEAEIEKNIEIKASEARAFVICSLSMPPARIELKSSFEQGQRHILYEGFSNNI